MTESFNCAWNIQLVQGRPDNPDMKNFTIVAHRGFAGKYPENTMAAMRAATEAGIHHLELDIQLTRDGVPVLLHDDTLDRTTNSTGSIFEYDLDDLAGVSNGEPARLGNTFSGERIVTLETFINWLAKDSQRHVYVEVKDECLDHFGFDYVIDKVLQIIGKDNTQVTIIGYDLNFLLAVRQRGWQGIGWVLTAFNEEEKRLAEQHQPDVIICNYKKVNTALWQGQWQWMFYEITEAALARHWVEQGASFIETMEVANLTAGLEQSEWQ
ncbi:MAG: glycerophosphodiester phosphodiesterase family protein [Gammaproteobacteria bacterium]|nr:glycerophosphodiester phosphodiesterase family protein [Gammaproteobacteria bacterium]